MFKVGDRVRVLVSEFANQLGEVTEVFDHSKYAVVMLDPGNRLDAPFSWFEPEPATPLVGIKHDDGKPKLSMIPSVALAQEATVFSFGAGKYGRDNYKLGMDWTRLIDAALRHITAFNDGENDDPESGISHLAHARCCLAMLMFYQHNRKGQDDRYTDVATIQAPETEEDESKE